MPLSPPRVAYQSSMWIPQQIPTRAEELRRLGLRIDPAELADPSSRILGGIISVGGCSASFVSPDGLIATNHHCVVRALEYNATPQKNLLDTGVLAQSRGDELSTGPAGRALLTLRVRDVTEEVHGVLRSAKSDLEREKLLQKAQKDLVQRCEQAQSDRRCQLVNYYDGLRYAIFERLELRDIRIAYAPAAGIGNFGGEVDNWRWPRHTGDIALLRAYVGRDGKPSGYSADNVPYRPAHWLRLSRNPLRVGDLVIVAGFPARTARLKTLEEVEDVVNWLYPRRLGMFDEYLAALDELGAANPEAKIKSVSWVRGFNNYRTKHLGELEGMRRVDLVGRKRTETERLKESIATNPEARTKYGIVLERLAAAFEEYEKTREADTELESEIAMPRLLAAANRIVRMAEERGLPDADRDPEYQERNWTTLRDELASVDKLYERSVDETLLGLALKRALRVPSKDRTPALEVIAGEHPTRASISLAVKRLYDSTKLSDSRLRQSLFEQASSKQLQHSTDPLIRLAVRLRPLFGAAEIRRKTLAGKLLELKPLYMEALLTLLGPNTPPDANGTLRVTYGTVRPSESARGNGASPKAFTTLKELLAKNTKAPPFNVPEPLVRAAAERRFGGYLDPLLQDVPVNFLSDVTISNGNSGSATLDAKGELVGVAFDGTYDSVVSDWVAVDYARSIHVDIRYVLWLLEQVEGATELLRELGATPG